nr:uncharacterized protein LOC129272418 [Lytechinus pictus]
MTIELPVERAQNVREECEKLLTQPKPTIRHVAHVIGNIISTFPAVQHGPLFYRNMEKEKIEALKKNKGIMTGLWSYHGNRGPFENIGLDEGITDVLTASLRKSTQRQYQDKEQVVISKLFSVGIGKRPEIHLFTDGSKEPDSIIKVKTFAVVQEGDEVPKIVKAKYDNYICVVGSETKGKPTYIRTDTREERDEWCRVLQTLMSMQTTPHQQTLEPHRGRTQTDATSDRPVISRARKGARTSTAPGSMRGIFRAELDKVIKKRANQIESIDVDCDDSQFCCGRHHIEAAATNDDGQDTYENVHHVHNLDDWRIKQQTSKQALKKTQELYQDFHKTNILQEQLGQPEDEYETPVNFQNFLPSTENRLSGFSTSSEESEGGASAMSAPWSLRSNKEPVESSWPSTPVPSDESEPEYHAELTNLKISKAESREESILCSKEPEASLCLDEQDEPVYVNTSLFQGKPGTVISRTPTLTRTPRENTCKPIVAERTQSVKKNKVPTKLPKRNQAKITQEIEDKCR